MVDIDSATQVTVIQTLTNDVVKDSIEACVKGTVALATAYESKYSNKKLVVSLPPPRQDVPNLNAKIRLINAHIINELSRRKNTHVLDNFGSFARNGYPDKKCFTDQGTRILVSNIKQQILSITQSQ